MWNYYRDEPNSGANNGIKYRIRGSKSFDYKRKFVENVTAANSTKEDVEVVIPFKHFSNFWRTQDIPLINCEIPLTLTWCKNCILISKEAGDGNYTANPILPKMILQDLQHFKWQTQYCMFQFLLYQKKWQQTFRTIKIRI